MKFGDEESGVWEKGIRIVYSRISRYKIENVDGEEQKV